VPPVNGVARFYFGEGVRVFGSVRITTPVLQALLKGVLDRLLAGKGLRLEAFRLRLGRGEGVMPFEAEVTAAGSKLGLTARAELTLSGSLVCDGTAVWLGEAEVGGPGVRGLLGWLASPFFNAVTTTEDLIRPYLGRRYWLSALFPGLSDGRLALRSGRNGVVARAGFGDGDKG